MPILSSGRIVSGSGNVQFSDTTTPNEIAGSTTPTSSSSVSSTNILSVTGQNVGVGDGLFSGTTGVQNLTLNFKSIIGGAGITVEQDQDTITFYATGETDTTFDSLVDSPGFILANAVLIGAANSAALKWTPAATTANSVLTYIGSGGFAWELHPASVALSSVGAVSGVASLDTNGKVPLSQLPTALTGALTYQGTWNASTNTPTLTSGVGVLGQYYQVSVVGATNLDGNANWQVGDLAIFNGSTWDGVSSIQNEVISVAGRKGIITLTVSDVANAASLNSPVFVGNPQAPTLTIGNSSTGIATTAFVAAATANSATFVFVNNAIAVSNSIMAAFVANSITTAIANALVNNANIAYVNNAIANLTTITYVANTISNALSNVALLNSPTFTGSPHAPTPTYGDSSNAIATTAFVSNAISGLSSGNVVSSVTSVAGRTGAVVLAVGDISGAAPLNSPILTGTPHAPTPSAGDNSVNIATTAFVNTAITSAVSGLSTGSGTGNGSVTSVSVTSNTNTITVSGSPITSNSSINIGLATITNIAGTYTAPTVTVDQYGRITNAVPGVAGVQSVSTTQSNNVANVYAGIVGAVSTINPIVGTGRITVSTGGNPAGIVLDLANSVVTPGTYPKVVVDTYGRVTGGGSLTSSDVTSLLAPRTFYSFVGNGVANSYVLSNSISTVNDILVSVGSVIKEPSVDYTYNSTTNTMTLTSAPNANTVVWVLGLGSTTAGANGAGANSISLTGDVVGNGTGTIVTSLATMGGLAAGTYVNPTVAVDTKGRVTYIANQSPANAKYTFVINFDVNGNIANSGSFSGIPVGWSVNLDTINQITVTHNLARFPIQVSTIAYNPTAAQWALKVPNGNPNAQFSVGINSTGTSPNTFTVYGISSSAVDGAVSSDMILSVFI